MNRRTAAQIIHRYAIIDEVTNEWLYEASTYAQCVRMAKAVVGKGCPYIIVAVMKEATNK